MHAGTALIYCRVSTRRQGEEGASLETQEEACVAHARDLGYEPGLVFREVYSGAEIFDRPRLNELRDAVKTGRYAAVVVYALDRLTRAQGLTAYLLLEFERAGAQLVSVTDPLESSATGKFLLGAKEFVAEIEREKIRERTMRGKHRHVQSGKVQTWGFAPYGYRTDKAAGVRRIHEPEASIVRQIFRWVAIDGLSVTAVAKRLNIDGVPSPGAGKYAGRETRPRWSTSGVSRILHRSEYKGEAYALTTEAAGPQRRRPRDRSEWVALPANSTPAIVEKNLWAAAQSAVAGTLSHRGRAPKHQYLLRGRIFCAVCGAPMRSTPDHGRYIYRCSSRLSADGPCGGKAAPASNVLPRAGHDRDRLGRLAKVEPAAYAESATVEGVDSWAWRQVAALLADPETIKRELRRRQSKRPAADLRGELLAAKRAQGKLDTQQKRLLRAYTESESASFPWTMVESEISRLEVEKRAVASRVDEIQATLRLRRSASSDVDRAVDVLARVAENIELFTFEDKRSALAALAVRVEANGREWRIVWDLAPFLASPEDL